MRSAHPRIHEAVSHRLLVLERVAVHSRRSSCGVGAVELYVGDLAYVKPDV